MAMSQVSYVGFKNLATSREYAFRVTQVDGTSNDFLFAVSNDAFLTHHAVSYTHLTLPTKRIV